ncbi:hypothetical protein BP5796_02244 [Coleophoma crateriformis]|uniref:F-box domain-containing protein n=1 Tax=Coleophoma crateriformis TaxID=565419 RepID=A0A3D8SXU1_9HELO|nr:hypothetical protein BP5796_02244 [Coleophoma crateriformis]
MSPGKFILDDSSRALLEVFPQIPGRAEKSDLTVRKSKRSKISYSSSRRHLKKIPICPLLKLPREIIQHIAAILPRPTAAVFTFTCKSIYAALDKEYWGPYRHCHHKRKLLLNHWYWKSPLGIRLKDPVQLVQSSSSLSLLIEFATTRPEKAALLERCCSESCMCRKEWILNEKLLRERRQVLELLGRDVPDMIRCGRCITLHRPGRKAAAKDSADLRECELQDAHFGVGKVIYDGFTFPHLQQAMKISRNGDGNQTFLRSLSWSKTFHSADLTQVHHTSTKCHISNDTFLVRSQYWILFPSASATIYPTSTLLGPNSKICAHLEFGDPDKNYILHVQDDQQSVADKSLDEVLRCRLRHISPKRTDAPLAAVHCGFCTGIQQCLHCETEFVIDTKPIVHGAQGTAIILTKWLSLGRGEMCGDAQWRRHFATNSSHVLQPKSSTTTPVNDAYPGEKEHPEIITWPKGSIRDAFERGRAFEFENALSKRRERDMWAEVDEVVKLRVLQYGVLGSGEEKSYGKHKT